MVKQNITPFICPKRQKQLLMRVILSMYSNQSIVQPYQTHKSLGKDSCWISDSVIGHIIILRYKPLSGSSYDVKLSMFNYQYSRYQW